MRFEVEVNGKKWTGNNTPTHEGVLHLLDRWIPDQPFHNWPSGNWDLGFVNADGFTGYSPADTYLSHPGWTAGLTYSKAPTTGQVQVDGDCLGAQLQISQGLSAPSVIKARGCFLQNPSAGKLWGTADFDEGLLYVEAGTWVFLRYIIRIEA